MNYAVYKNARNASWQCLLGCGITELPINPSEIAKMYGIRCKAVKPEILGGSSGIIRKNLAGIITIYYDGSQIPARQRFTIMHELGHYVLGHLGDTPLSRSEQECRPEEEAAADRFAVDMLMPACVLWGLDIHTADDIARVCGVSMQAAQIRADRMEVLYRRNMFLSHPLERRIFEQFKPWIDEQSNQSKN